MDYQKRQDEEERLRYEETFWDVHEVNEEMSEDFERLMKKMLTNVILEVFMRKLWKNVILVRTIGNNQID